MGDQLFVLADYRGEIKLLALQLRKTRDGDRIVAHPDVLWSQTLIAPNEGVVRFPLRRMAGLSPSYAGGVLLCPTTSGAIVAVDPARRLLLWGVPLSDKHGERHQAAGMSSIAMPACPPTVTTPKAAGSTPASRFPEAGSSSRLAIPMNCIAWT